MTSLHVRTNQDTNPSPDPADGLYEPSKRGAADAFGNGRESLGASSSHTLATCSSWTTASPSSLALRPTFSVDSSSDDDDDDAVAIEECPADERHAVPVDDTVRSQEKGSDTTPCKSNTTRELTSERKRWIEETLIHSPCRSYSTNARRECSIRQQRSGSAVASERRQWVEQTLLSTDCKSYATDAREEMCQRSYNSEVTSERKRWIRSTLLSTEYTPPRRGNDSRRELQELQNVSSSVAERRKWLSGATRVKTAAELEEEVRLEMARKREEEEARKRAAEEEEARRKEEEDARTKEDVQEAHVQADEEGETLGDEEGGARVVTSEEDLVPIVEDAPVELPSLSICAMGSFDEVVELSTSPCEKNANGRRGKRRLLGALIGRFARRTKK